MEFVRDTSRRIQQVVSMPIIWSLIVPLVVFDLWVEIYHRTCFYLYGIKYIQRSQYIRIDRHKLKYLRAHEKLGCVYCGYANGLVQYWTAIFAETKKYWCGIMHKKHGTFHPPKHHEGFVEHGDEKAFTDRFR